MASKRFRALSQFDWDKVRGTEPEEWRLYVPSLREQVVELSGRVDYTTYTTEHAEQLTAMLGENLLGLREHPTKNPDVGSYAAGSDDD